MCKDHKKERDIKRRIIYQILALKLDDQKSQLQMRQSSTKAMKVKEEDITMAFQFIQGVLQRKSQRENKRER